MRNQNQNRPPSGRNGHPDFFARKSTRAALLMTLCSGAHREADAFDRAINLRITRLRRKVEIDPAHPEALRTVRGVGYMFVPPKD